MIKTEDLLSVVASGPKSIVLVTDEKYLIRYASETVSSIFGIQPYALLGKNALNFVPLHERAKWYECLRDSNNNRNSEITLPSRTGDRHFDISVVNHIGNDRIKGLVVSLHDITDQKAELIKLESANHHLDHFIFKTTHDLRAPIHSALGLVSLAERARDGEREKYLHLIKSSLLKLESFIEEVNSFYKNDKLAILNERIDLREMLASEIENLANQPDAQSIQFHFEVDEEKILYTDPIRLKTIITNILSNSIKYSDTTKKRRFIHIEAKIQLNSLQVKIEDNGIGIAPEHQARIFEMFFRGNNQSKGTGLGLYIVKDTIERLGGEIKLTSTVGEGTTFFIQVPNRVQESVLN